MTVEIISRSISTKVWDRAGIELGSDSHLLPDTLPTALRGPVAQFKLMIQYYSVQKRVKCEAVKQLPQRQINPSENCLTMHKDTLFK